MILETPRLRLRELETSDLDFVAAMTGDAEVMRHYPKPLDRAEAAGAVRDLAFTTWDRPYVISLIRPVNVPSQAVARRIGMAPTRLVEFHGYEHVVWRVERN